MYSYNWKNEITSWMSLRRSISTSWHTDILQFFELAFSYTRCPEKAWFGVHKQTVSLVVGGIFLASIHHASVDRGVWLLVDSDDVAIHHWIYSPARSTAQSIAPLFWLHSDAIAGISDISKNTDIWEHYALATEKIRFSTRIASDRNAVQVRRGKQQLSNFYNRAINVGTQYVYGEEHEQEQSFIEGAVYRVSVNAYERNPDARRQCIAHFGAQCQVCGFDFGQVYGEQGQGFIHVHHLRPLADIGTDYQVDPFIDLMPVCANCHAMIHRQKPPYSLQEVSDMLQNQRLNH